MKCLFLQKNQLRVTHNAYKQYIRSRPPAATESIKRAKQIENEMVLGMHPVLSMLDKTVF